METAELIKKIKLLENEAQKYMDERPSGTMQTVIANFLKNELKRIRKDLKKINLNK